MLIAGMGVGQPDPCEPVQLKPRTEPVLAFQARPTVSHVQAKVLLLTGELSLLILDVVL